MKLNSIPISSARSFSIPSFILFLSTKINLMLCFDFASLINLSVNLGEKLKLAI